MKAKNTNQKENGREMNYTDTNIFLDTNIFAYMFDSKDKKKQQRARTLVSSLILSKYCHISTQVLQELFNVLTRKIKYTKEEAQKIVLDFMDNIPVYQITAKDIARAMQISISTQFTIYDSLILSAAKSEQCAVVYSEDLNSGQIVDGVKIVNPFD